MTRMEACRKASRIKNSPSTKRNLAKSQRFITFYARMKKNQTRKRVERVLQQMFQVNKLLGLTEDRVLH